MEKPIQATLHLDKIPAGKYVIHWTGIIDNENIESIIIEKLKSNNYSIIINGETRFTDVEDFMVGKPSGLESVRGAIINVVVNGKRNSYFAVNDGTALIKATKEAFGI